MPSRAAAAARPWPMPPPSAAMPMPRPAAIAIMPKLFARPWGLTAASAPCAKASEEKPRMTRTVASEDRILMVRFMGGAPWEGAREAVVSNAISMIGKAERFGKCSVILVLDRHADVDHRQRAEDERLDQADQEAE